MKWIYNFSSNIHANVSAHEYFGPSILQKETMKNKNFAKQSNKKRKPKICIRSLNFLSNQKNVQFQTKRIQIKLNLKSPMRFSLIGHFKSPKFLKSLVMKD